MVHANIVQKTQDGMDKDVFAKLITIQSWIIVEFAQITLIIMEMTVFVIKVGMEIAMDAGNVMILVVHAQENKPTNAPLVLMLVIILTMMELVQETHHVQKDYIKIVETVSPAHHIAVNVIAHIHVINVLLDLSFKT